MKGTGRIFIVYYRIATCTAVAWIICQRFWGNVNFMPSTVVDATGSTVAANSGQTVQAYAFPLSLSIF